MKHLLFLLAFALISSMALSQTYPPSPLYGTTSNSDRTFRSLQLGFTTIADTAGSTIDTIPLIPGFVNGVGAVFHKDYILNLTDSCVLAIANTSSSYKFSTMTIYINAPALSGKVKFSGFSLLPATQWALSAAATSISPTASHWFVLNLVCTGTAWVEQSRSQD